MCSSVTLIIFDLHVAILHMVYNIRCNPMHPLYGALPVLYVPVQVTRSVLVAHWYTYALPHCRTSQYRSAFIPLPLSVPVERSCIPSIRWCETGGFQEQGQCFFIGLSFSIPTIFFYFFSLSLLSVYRLVLWGWSLWTDRVYITLSQPCTADLF